MKHKIKQYGLSLLCSIILVCTSVEGAFADSIDLGGLISTNISETWNPEAGFEIQTDVTGMEINDYLFESGTSFLLKTTSYSEGIYAGTLEIKNETELFISASFNDLTIPDLPSGFFGFSATTFSDIDGSLALDGFNLAGATGLWMISSNAFFTGSITLNRPEEPTPNPEPATFFLFGLGLLGIAGMGRKR